MPLDPQDTPEEEMRAAIQTHRASSEAGWRAAEGLAKQVLLLERRYLPMFVLRDEKNGDA
jgi:hypothetical protein